MTTVLLIETRLRIICLFRLSQTGRVSSPRNPPRSRVLVPVLFRRGRVVYIAGRVGVVPNWVYFLVAQCGG